MTEAVELAEKFLPKDAKIVSVNSKIAEQKKEYRASGKKRKPQYKIIILVNQDSASASEIFSACMQDNGLATLVGMRTYGKASVQSVIPLDDVSAMKMTTARYMRPSGKIIDAVGVEPNEIVENGPAGTPGADHQTQKALELLKAYL